MPRGCLMRSLGRAVSRVPGLRHVPVLKLFVAVESRYSLVITSCGNSANGSWSSPGSVTGADGTCRTLSATSSLR
jgi:hypothetical protein